MSEKVNVSLSFNVSEETSMKLKIMAIQKKTTLQKLCRDIMEKFVSGKRGATLEQQIDQTDV